VSAAMEESRVHALADETSGRQAVSSSLYAHGFTMIIWWGGLRCGLVCVGVKRGERIRTHLVPAELDAVGELGQLIVRELGALHLNHHIKAHDRE
jgi:hypothetical protein